MATNSERRESALKHLLFPAVMMEAKGTINAILLKSVLVIGDGASDSVEMWLELKRLIRRLDIMTKGQTNSV